MNSCALCGATAESDPPPLTWSTGTERGVTQWYCDTCSRTHLRAIESKLEPEWW